METSNFIIELRDGAKKKYENASRTITKSSMLIHDATGKLIEKIGLREVRKISPC
jgi:hypothetical protein